MTQPESLINKLPRPPGVPSKHWIKIASAVLLLLVILALMFSYQDEPLKTGDDLARISASTLSAVERSHVDQNHQIIEDAFKASGLPTDLSALQQVGESSVSRPFNPPILMDGALKLQEQGIMKSALVHSSPLPFSSMPPTPFKSTVGLPPSSLAGNDSTFNAVTLAQETEVMNSKIVIVDFDDLRRQKEAPPAGEPDRSSRALPSGNEALGNLGLKERRLKSLMTSLEDLDQVGSSKSKSSPASPASLSSLTSSPSESPAFWEALSQALGKDNDKSTPVSARSQDGDFLRDLKSNPLFKPGLKPNRLESERSILEGTIIAAVLTRDINSDLPGTITAQVTQTVYDSITLKAPLICKGAKLIGRYSNDIRTGQSRLLFAFTRLILLNGQSFNLLGFDGSDALGQAGISGEVDNHFLRIYGSSLAIGALSDQITRQQAVPQGAFASSSSTGQIMVQTTREILQKGRDQAPTITVARGSLINVEVRQDLVFTGGDRLSCT